MYLIRLLIHVDSNKSIIQIPLVLKLYVASDMLSNGIYNTHY